MGFENEFSNFPDQLIALHEYENVSDAVASLINQINALRKAGDYSGAQEIIKKNTALLSKSIVDATTFRTWEEEIYNTQLYAKRKKQDIYFDRVEPDCEVNDVWISEEGGSASEDPNYIAGYQVGYGDGVKSADMRTNTESASYKAGYSQGVSDADGRSNPNSQNYQDGYNAGYQSGYNTGKGNIVARERTITSNSKEQSFTFNAEGVVVCAGIKSCSYHVASYDEGNVAYWREMTANASCSFSGNTITVTVGGGNQPSLERRLTAVISYATL